MLADSGSRYYGAIIPSLLNVLSMQGYLVVNSIIGGQVLAEVSGHLSATVGIVIIALTTLIVSRRCVYLYVA